MSVESTTIKTTVVGSGSSGQVVSVPFAFAVNGDVRVVLTDANGLDSDLTLGTHYTLSGAGAPSGGSCSLLFTATGTQKITVVLDPPITQLRSYTPNSNFPAESHESALDKLTRICQRLKEMIGRTFMVGESGVVASLTNRIFGTDAQGKFKQFSFTEARTALNASAVDHAHTWEEIEDKPTSFTPSTHTHSEFTTLTPTTPPISTNEVKATGTITVTDIPTIGQTLTIGGIVYTFAATQVNPFDIAITEPASITTVATAIATRINARDRNVVATRSGAVITLTAIALREDGNLVTLTTAASNLTLSGSALTGGASTTATATTGNNMQHAVVASRHVFICVNSGFSTNWILLS